MYSSSTVFIMFLIADHSLATTRDEYVAFMESRIVEQIFRGQPELTELAHELMHLSPEDPTEFSAKREALQGLMWKYDDNVLNISEREEEFVYSGIWLLSPHIRSEEALRLGLVLLDLYNRTHAITPRSFSTLIRLIAMPLGEDESRFVSKRILQHVENELGAESDDLKVLRATLDRVIELVAKHVLIGPPQETESKTRKPKPRCATQVCNETLEQIYTFANEAILVPILGNRSELHERALKLMKTNVQNETMKRKVNRESEALFHDMGMGMAWDSSFFLIVTNTIHKGPADSEEELVEFFQFLKSIIAADDPKVASKYYQLYTVAALGDLTGTQLTFSGLRGAIRTNPRLTPEEKEAMLAQTLRFKLPIRVCCNMKATFPTCEKDRGQRQAGIIANTSA